MKAMRATWLILGASSPVGRAFAWEAARRGYAVLLAGRDREDLEATAADLRIRSGKPSTVVTVDAEDLDRHQAFVEACLVNREGVLNVFLAIGAMPEQEAINKEFALAHRTMTVNYVGVVSILSRLAPVLEEQRAGAIVALGSTAGDRGRLKNYVYGSAKAGLHAYLQGLRARLYRSGVTVTTVKPGFVDTAMTWGQPLPLPPASPERLAQACWRFAEQGTDVAYYPWFWGPVMTVLKALPERVFKRFRF